MDFVLSRKDLTSRILSTSSNHSLCDPWVIQASQQCTKMYQNFTGEAHSPFALETKYPNTVRQWGWQYGFTSERISKDLHSAKIRRHHTNGSGLQSVVQKAARLARPVKPISPHTFRHRFTTHLLETGYDIRTAQALLRQKNASTSMVCTHVIAKGGMGV